jgi:hypothetical protein
MENWRAGGLNVCAKSLATFLVPVEGEALVNVRLSKLSVLVIQTR